MSYASFGRSNMMFGTTERGAKEGKSAEEIIREIERINEFDHLTKGHWVWYVDWLKRERDKRIPADLCDQLILLAEQRG